MQAIGEAVKQRFEQIIFENEMMRAGFAALPYLVLRDTRLSVGARLTYAVLISYGWQNAYAFPGQERMATDMGISDRHLRRWLGELVEYKYIRIKRQGLNKPNIYYILDVKTKLKRGKSEADRTRVSYQERTQKSD